VAQNDGLLLTARLHRCVESLASHLAKHKTAEGGKMSVMQRPKTCVLPALPLQTIEAAPIRYLHTGSDEHS
jgi:hypothetical protein